jgi:hypothetical protein
VANVREKEDWKYVLSSKMVVCIHNIHFSPVVWASGVCTGWPQCLVTPYKNGDTGYIMVADDPDRCYRLFPIQLKYLFTLLHILQHMTEALIVKCICLCSIILMTQNNTAPCSVGHILEHLCGDTIKSMSHCLFKVISGLVALLRDNLLNIFAGVTRHCGHPVLCSILI